MLYYTVKRHLLKRTGMTEIIYSLTILTTL